MSINILLVEDNVEFAETIVDFLGTCNYNAAFTVTIKDAIEATYSKTYDLILLDIKLPDGNGIDLLKELKSWNDSVPILMLTSQSLSSSVAECLNLGADDYIKKPCDLDELLARIQAALRRVYKNRRQQIELGNGYVFDVACKRLLKDGKEVNLGSKANALLALLCANKNYVVDLDTIANTIWSTDEQASSGSLRVYVNAIRKHIGNDRITNYRNLGYKLD